MAAASSTRALSLDPHGGICGVGGSSADSNKGASILGTIDEFPM